MSESSFLAGVAGAVEFRGRRYEVAVRTLGMESLFEVWARQQALDNILRHQRTMPAHVFQVMIDRWAERSAFVYQWSMPGCTAARVSPAGVRYAAWLQMTKLDPSVTRELVDEMCADKALCDLLERFAVGDLDPNPPAPPGGEKPSA